MSSIFPFIEPTEVVNEDRLIETEVELAREWAWDFDKDEFKLKNGEMYIVEKDEAIKIWIYKIVNTERFKYIIYDHDFGIDLMDYIGTTITHAYIKSEIQRVITEAILSTLSDYVKKLINFDIQIDTDVLMISFTVITIYNEKGVKVDGVQVFRYDR